MALWVKDMALPQLQQRLQLQLGFDPWPGNSYMLWVGFKTKKKTINNVLYNSVSKCMFSPNLVTDSFLNSLLATMY